MLAVAHWDDDLLLLVLDGTGPGERSPTQQTGGWHLLVQLSNAGEY